MEAAWFSAVMVEIFMIYDVMITVFTITLCL